MKGIYLTEECKKDIEDIIIELNDQIRISESLNDNIRASLETYEKKVYEMILESAIILPVEENWDDLSSKFWHEENSKRLYPNGLIIQPKK
jgi:hypothetical protein